LFFGYFASRTYLACELGNFRKFPAENFRKFIPIFPEMSGNLLITYVNRLFPSPALQRDAANKHVFLNNFPDLHALTVCIMLRKIFCFSTAARNISELE